MQINIRKEEIKTSKTTQFDSLLGSNFDIAVIRRYKSVYIALSASFRNTLEANQRLQDHFTKTSNNLINIHFSSIAGLFLKTTSRCTEDQAIDEYNSMTLAIQEAVKTMPATEEIYITTFKG